MKIEIYTERYRLGPPLWLQDTRMHAFTIDEATWVNLGFPLVLAINGYAWRKP